MIEQWLSLTFAFIAGMALGGFHFGGLWLTMRRLGTVKRPGLLLGVSAVVRFLVIIVGFYFVTDGQWERLLVSLIGLIIVRKVMVKRIQADTMEKLSSAKEKGAGQ